MNEAKAIELAQAMRGRGSWSFLPAVHELLAAILDPVEPVPVPVDWTKPIELEGVPLVFLSDIPTDANGYCKVSYSLDTELFIRTTADGRTGNGRRIINTPEPQPEPVELGYEVAVATKGSLLVPSARTKMGRIAILKCEPDFFTAQSSAEVIGWSFSAWQPCTVKG